MAVEIFQNGAWTVMGNAVAEKVTASSYNVIVIPWVEGMNALDGARMRVNGRECIRVVGKHLRDYVLELEVEV
jgi:hypothetical protein